MEKRKLNDLLDQMTLQEKIGQLTQFTTQYLGREGGELTGVMGDFPVDEVFIHSLGSVLNAENREEVITIQREHLEQDRLKIPLIFMRDIIHGYRTTFPVPLALGATFDPELVEEVSHIAGEEAAKEGIQVTFSPMADLARDARWGRVVEGTGEDPELNAALSAAMVRGYQGEPEKLATDPTRLAACVKHYAGYGAVTAGRDYSTVDFSRLALHQDYLPAFKSAIDAGAKMVMPAFTFFEGIPATASHYLLKDVLREYLKFDGALISDWGSVGKFIDMHIAGDQVKASELALNAGLDMDMMSGAFVRGLEEAVENGHVAISDVNAAVMNMLVLKNDLGLFEDPYRQIDKLPVPAGAPTISTRAAAKKAAISSTVLLKNLNVLPIRGNTHIGVTGPLADSPAILGPWSSFGKHEDAITLLQGLREQYQSVIELPLPVSTDPADFADCDIIVAALGEREEDSGESACKTLIELPEDQVALVRRLQHIGKPVVGIIFAGRPLALTNVLPYLDGIIYAWFPGIEGGHALADIVSGRAVPEGRLPMTFPRTTGQVPIYYNLARTGHIPNDQHPTKYTSRYVDCVNSPLFPFGFGLSYGKVEYGKATLDGEVLKDGRSISVSIPITNIADQKAVAVIECFVGSLMTEVVRPEAELKHWQKLHLGAHETKIVTFQLSPQDLAYVHQDLQRRADKGDFIVRVGINALNYQELQAAYD